jgi:hypothetical protein
MRIADLWDSGDAAQMRWIQAAKIIGAPAVGACTG